MKKVKVNDKMTNNKGRLRSSVIVGRYKDPETGWLGCIEDHRGQVYCEWYINGHPFCNNGCEWLILEEEE